MTTHTLDFALPDYKTALESMTEATLAQESDFIHAQIHEFDTFNEWVKFVLTETTYGMALIVSCEDDEDTQIVEYLQGVWDAFFVPEEE